MILKRYLIIAMLLNPSIVYLNGIDEDDFEEITPDQAKTEFADISTLERDIAHHTLIEPIKTALPKSTIEISGETGPKNTGLFGRALKFVTDPVKRRSIENQIKSHAEQINENPLIVSEADKTFLKNLSTKEQQEIIDQWAKTHQNTFQHALDTLHTRYKNNVTEYRSGDQKAQLKIVESNKKDITKNNSLIQKKQLKIKTIDNELNKENLKAAKRASLASEKYTLENDIEALRKDNAEKTAINEATLYKIKQNHAILDENYNTGIKNLYAKYDNRNTSFFNTIKDTLDNKVVTNKTENASTSPILPDTLIPHKTTITFKDNNDAIPDQLSHAKNVYVSSNDIAHIIKNISNKQPTAIQVEKLKNRLNYLKKSAQKGTISPRGQIELKSITKVLEQIHNQNTLEDEENLSDSNTYPAPAHIPKDISPALSFSTPSDEEIERQRQDLLKSFMHEEPKSKTNLDPIEALINVIGDTTPTDFQARVLKNLYVKKYNSELETDDQDQLIKNRLTRLHERLLISQERHSISPIEQIELEALTNVLQK